MVNSVLAKARHRSASGLREFLDSEASGGVVLMIAAAAALVFANSPAASVYFSLLDSHIAGQSVLHWINDGLMAAFFLLVGLEIKREFLEGELASWGQRILPGIAAAGGMIAPAIIYLVINSHSIGTQRGWAIPTATDIAFALGVLSLLGSRVPISLKIFLTALAIIDDLGAVAIIAVFYAAELSPVYLGAATLTFAILVSLNRAGIQRSGPYLLLGIALWYFTLKSGVHATIAGVALAMTIPVRQSSDQADNAKPMLYFWEHVLHPWVAFAILPIFGFANAGVQFSSIGWSTVLAPVTLGIAAGLFAGKQLGVFLTAFLAVKLRISEPPANASLAQLYGISLLCGVGFTMSLFIGMLAFPDLPHLQTEVKTGVLLGSLLSAIIGALALLWAPPASEQIASRQCSNRSARPENASTTNEARKGEVTCACSRLATNPRYSIERMNEIRIAIIITINLDCSFMVSFASIGSST
jgi:Na+:H+ antiporter, NhaA family